ncbi:PA14 domain-containing protein [Methylococcus sp. EFPC2]|uniref:PA14 domain-containing protein n=1 Tax=Methylococcus sp. EFPC2 TaxID=2812648 RepID=UPI0019683B77|nr:PA14 domain-containing protein [Methylococcus sp. EFPC2]QSA97285.1 hypothetical protein JWZ97_00070 [Methylococcus sp. EFPC2]
MDHKYSALILFALLVLSFPPVQACEAPSESFCADYFRGIGLSGPVLATETTSKIDFDWKNGRPHRRVSANFFSARWEGIFDFDAHPYEFMVRADDGIRVAIDGTIVIDRWKPTRGQKNRTTLTPGSGKHRITVEYFELTGLAGATVDWHPITSTNSVAFVTYNAKGALAVSQQAPWTNSPPRLPIGINLSTFDYWNSAVPFKDLMMQSGVVGVYKQASNDRCETQPPLVNNGYPKYVPAGCRIRIFSTFQIKNEYWPNGVPTYRPGHYVLLHKGVGTIKLSWDAANVKYTSAGRIEFDVPTPGTGLQIEIVNSDNNNPVHDMHIVHADDEATFRTQPFNEKWLNILKPFNVIRFMDWGRVSQNITKYSGAAVAHTTNTLTLPSSAPSVDNLFNGMVTMINVNGKYPRVFIEKYDGASRTLFLRSPIELSTTGAQPTLTIFDFPNKTWEERAQPTTLGQTTNAGVAFEYMIDLANTINANPWINIPTAADDRFVQELAKLIKSRLKPTLKCYIEYSNETWNYGWPGYHYSEAKVNDMKLTGTWIPADAWQAYRAVEIFRIFNQVFGERDLREQRNGSRLVRVLTSQTAWLDRAMKVMDWTNSGNTYPTLGIPAHKFADAWGMTTYFSAPGGAKTIELASTTELIDMQIAAIDQEVAKTPKPGLFRQIIEACRKRGLQVVAYEGGTHLLAPQERTDLVAKVVLTNRESRMEQLYSHALTAWENLAKEYGSSAIGVWNQYYDVGRYSKYGYWGILESTYQDPSTVPKYKAIQSFVNGNRVNN